MRAVAKCVLFFLMGSSFSAFSQKHKDAALEFLSTLNDSQKQKLVYKFDDQERFNWNFVPTKRNGLSFHDFTEKQKASAIELLRASLSQRGSSKAQGIIALEKILQGVEGRGADDTYRDPLNYFFTIFGDPKVDKVWGWRIEGHHLALNFSSAGDVIAASTPTFMGANPATVPSGPEKGKQTLKDETDLGFALVNSLSKDQLAVARFSEVALPEIVSGNSRKAQLLEPRGILYKALTPSQQKLFMNLLDVFVRNYQFDFSEKLYGKIRAAGLDTLSFAWAGSLHPGKGHYYRIQGPMLLIEYDNTQTNANHVHTTVRDLTNDFAEDILREHYEREHK